MSRNFLDEHSFKMAQHIHNTLNKIPFKSFIWQFTVKRLLDSALLIDIPYFEKNYLKKDSILMDSAI